MDSVGPVKRTAFLPACGGICAVLESLEGGDGDQKLAWWWDGGEGCGWAKEGSCKEVMHRFYDALHRCSPLPCSMGLEAHREVKEMEEIMEQWEDAGPLPWFPSLF